MRKPSNQQNILNIFDHLKHNLTQNNSINIANLHSLNVNFEYICKYAKQGFKILTQTIHKQKQIIYQLTNIIKKQGLESQINHLDIDLQSNADLFELNHGIAEFIASKNDNSHNSQYLQSNMPLYRKDKPKMKNDHTNKPSYQQNLFNKFVTSLKDRLEYASQIGSQIPKSVILTNFFNFCQQHNCKLDPRHYSKVQMALTNFIKNHFPKSSQTHISFRGIKFKSQYNNLHHSHASINKQDYRVQDN